MVWFQCEVCGENLKKPKLPNHFRICSASKLSCIDCGQIFGQQTVQGHTQCITEAEKYGPKGQGKASGASVKPKNDKQKTDIDINVGLSERAPWFCSLCKTNATSQQTLFIHAEGKRHRAKARAFHAANQQPKQAESTPHSKILTENNQNAKLPGNVDIEQEDQNPHKVAQVHSSAAGNGNLLPSKKRKLEESKNDVTGEKAGGNMSGELENEGVIQVEGAGKEETKNKLKKVKHSMTEKCNVTELNGNKEDAKKKIKWKKLIKSALKSNPDGGLKLRKLREHILEVLRESGFTEDESQITDMLEQKINSSSKFMVDGKFVRLVAKS